MRHDGAWVLYNVFNGFDFDLGLTEVNDINATHTAIGGPEWLIKTIVLISTWLHPASPPRRDTDEATVVRLLDRDFGIRSFETIYTFGEEIGLARYVDARMLDLRERVRTWPDWASKLVITKSVGAAERAALLGPRRYNILNLRVD